MQFSISSGSPSAIFVPKKYFFAYRLEPRIVVQLVGPLKWLWINVLHPKVCFYRNIPYFFWVVPQDEIHFRLDLICSYVCFMKTWLSYYTGCAEIDCILCHFRSAGFNFLNWFYNPLKGHNPQFEAILAWTLLPDI